MTILHSFTEKKKILVQWLHLKLLLSLINNYFMHHSNITENCSKSFTLVWLSKTHFIHPTTDFFPLWYLTLLPLIIKSCSYFCQLSSYFWFCGFCSSPAVPFSGCRRCCWGLWEPAEDSGTWSCPGVHHPSSQPFTGNLKQKHLQYNVGFFLFRLMSQKWRTARV